MKCTRSSVAPPWVMQTLGMRIRSFHHLSRPHPFGRFAEQVNRASVPMAMRLKSALEILPRLYGSNGYLHAAGYLFVIGHMRSYSSLLAHILGSHPRIVGYAEMHQKYRTVLDLLELSRKVERTCDKGCAGRYVLDKIL